jgi:glycosyltransferase involved in cell wall biosynthesis
LIRIANIIEEGKVGGPQVRIVNIANFIQNKATTVVIMPKSNSREFQILCGKNQIKFKTLPISRITKEWRVVLKYLFFSFFEVIRIAFYLRKNNFDIVHVSGGSWQYKGVIAGKIAGVKVIWHLNDTYTPFLLRKAFSLISVFSDGFIFASEASKSYYKGLIKAKKEGYIIPSGVDTKKFSPNAKYKGDELIISQMSGKFVIGMIANINPVKGIENFVRVAKVVNAKVNNCQFVVIGKIYENQENYYKKVKLLSNSLRVDNISFVNEKKDVRPLLNRFDVYLCTSKYESSPISVWEAMSMGKPIVSTDVGDVSIYVKSNINGYVEKGNIIEALAKRLIYLNTNRDICYKFGNESRAIAKNNLDLSFSADKHIVAYMNTYYKSSKKDGK